MIPFARSGSHFLDHLTFLVCQNVAMLFCMPCNLMTNIGNEYLGECNYWCNKTYTYHQKCTDKLLNNLIDDKKEGNSVIFN